MKRIATVVGFIVIICVAVVYLTGNSIRIETTITEEDVKEVSTLVDRVSSWLKDRLEEFISVAKARKEVIESGGVQYDSEDISELVTGFLDTGGSE